MGRIRNGSHSKAEDRSPITLHLSEGDKNSLERLAAKLGYYWGGKPSMGAMIRAVAKKEYILVPATLLESPDRQLLRKVNTMRSFAVELRSILDEIDEVIGNDTIIG